MNNHRELVIGDEEGVIMSDTWSRDWLAPTMWVIPSQAAAAEFA